MRRAVLGNAMVRTFELVFKCPDVRTQEDEIIIQQTMAAAPGIGDVEVDHRTGYVRIVTANQDGGIDVRQRLEGAGYPPVEEDDVVASPEPGGA